MTPFADPRHVAALAGRRVLLVDDVMTSGATLAAATDALHAAGARMLHRPRAAADPVIARARAMGPDAAARLVERCWEAERRHKLSSRERAELSLLVADLCLG